MFIFSLLSLICFVVTTPLMCQTTFEAKGRDGVYSKLTNQILCRGDNPTLIRFAKIVCDDLTFTDQFNADVKKTTQAFKKMKAKQLFKQGVSLLTFFTTKRVRVKDTSSDTILFDKKIKIDEKKLVTQGHMLASEILEKLTGDKGVCLTSIAYCKMLASHHKVICLSDYACKKGKIVVPTKSINLAPSWHTKVPLLFYSQLTKSNNRLMSVDLRTGTHKVICSYAGLNMQPAFSADGKTSVICLSGGRGNSELYLYDPRLCKKAGTRVFKPLTRNGAHNVSPCLLANNDVVFCSDYQTGLPQIYYLDRKTGTTKRLTGGKGYCAAPSYSGKTNMLVYTRPVKGTFQLFTILLDDLDDVQEKQITSCEGNKHEPSWSPCGRYITFSLDRPDDKGRNTPQVAAMNYNSGIVRVLTKSPEAKSFPRWTGQKLAF